MIFTRETLDAAGCDEPNCGHDHSTLFLHSRCHTSAGTRVEYRKSSGSLLIKCRICGARVAEILVAASETPT